MELRDFAKWNLVKIQKDENLETALKRMEAANIHHLFVESENGLIGVVSQSKIVEQILNSEDKNQVLSERIYDLVDSHLNELSSEASLGRL